MLTLYTENHKTLLWSYNDEIKKFVIKIEIDDKERILLINKDQALTISSYIDQSLQDN
jgi:hypothetical protein